MSEIVTKKDGDLNHLPDPHAQIIEFDHRLLTGTQFQCEPGDIINFLKHLSVCGIVALACERARVGRPTVYKLRKGIPAFAEAWKSAMRTANDYLEREAFRRGVEGIPDEDKKRYSDKLLTTLLTSRHPKYKRTPKVVVNNENSATAGVINVDTGPPVPKTGGLSEWAGDLAQIAAQQKEREDDE